MLVVMRWMKMAIWSAMASLILLISLEMREAWITKMEFGQFKCLTEKSQFFPFEHSHLCMPSLLGNIIDSHILRNLLQLGRPSSLFSHSQVSLSLTQFSQLVSIKHWQRLLEIILFVSFFFISNSLGLSWWALLSFFIPAKSFQLQDSTHTPHNSQKLV